MDKILNEIKFTLQKKINVDGGDIYHILKKSNYKKFELKEAYFSLINYGFIKGWKMHTKMSSNLCVPIGKVKFTFVSKDFKQVKTYVIGKSNYGVLSVPPNIWFSFKGLSKRKSLILNLSNFEYDKKEIKKINLDEFPLKIKL